MGKRKKGKCAKHAQKQNLPHVEDDVIVKSPHVFVINRGHISSKIKQLMLDTREIFEPYTASKLKVKPTNTFKDFINISGIFHIHNIISFSMTEKSFIVRICKVPHGPTLTFKILAATLSKDVSKLIKKFTKNQTFFQNHPLLILSGFNGNEIHQKILAMTFQNMIPTIDILKVNLNKIKRCLLIKYDSNDGILHIRHYVIKVNPCLSRGLKKIVKGKIPNLSHFNDIHDYVTREQISESEMEVDGTENQILLSQSVAGKGNVKSNQSAIRLIEIGPRLKLQLIKIEEGLNEGRVLYHHFIKKTPEDLIKLEQLHQAKMKQKLVNDNDKTIKQETKIKKRKKLRKMETASHESSSPHD